MDIQRAKEEIKHTVQAYLACDDTGAPLIPPVRQRPILLMGPPGVGKTQIRSRSLSSATLLWWPTPSPTTPGKVPWVCRLSGSGTTAAKPAV